jgi:hypothetical protein
VALLASSAMAAPPAGSRAQLAAAERRQLQVDDRVHTVR